jgi:formyl-CoA transferase
MANDPALANNAGRVPQTKTIDDAIQSWCSGRDIDEALNILKAADVPVSKIYSVRDMMQDPQFLARQMFEQHLFKDGSPVKLPAVTPKLSETPGGTQWIGPELGEHTEEVLAELGYSTEEIQELRQARVL